MSSGSENIEWTMSAQKIIQMATAEAKANKSGVLHPYHIAYGTFADVAALGSRLATKAGVDPDRLRELLKKQTTSLPQQNPAPREALP